jgi:hypothetical protein
VLKLTAAAIAAFGGKAPSNLQLFRVFREFSICFLLNISSELENISPSCSPTKLQQPTRWVENASSQVVQEQLPGFRAGHRLGFSFHQQIWSSYKPFFVFESFNYLACEAQPSPSGLDFELALS